MADVQLTAIDQQDTQIVLAMADVQLTVVDQQDTQIVLAVPGVQGPVGEGVPNGGTTNQVLFKQSGTNYDTAWSEITSAMIGDLEIADADVAANAEIAVSKLADGSARQLLQTDAAGTGVEWTSNIDVPGTLDVTGATTLDSTLTVPLGSAAAPTLRFIGDPNTGIYSPGADQVAISTAGTGRLFVDANGRVGIGTASPAVTLTVATAASGEALRLANGTNAERLHFYTGANAVVEANNSNLALTARDSNGIIFSTVNAERMRLDSVGRLGLGTSSPGAILHSRAAALTGATYRSGATLITETSGNNEIQILSGSASYGQLRFGDGDSNYRGAVSYDHATDCLRFVTSAVEQAQISSAGGLLIYGTSKAEASPAFSVSGSAPAGSFTIDSSGRLGIGTTSPSTLLHTNTASGFNIFQQDSGSVGNYFYADSTGVGWVGTRTNHPFAFGTNNSERVRIDTSGRLLVGTSSASTTLGSLTAKMQVQGTNVFDTGIINALWESSTNPAQLQLIKSRGASIGTHTVVQNNDNLGRITFGGSDGTDFEYSAWIQSEVDGTPGANDMPGRLVFSTTADGASSPTERMRINSSGQILAGALGTAALPIISFLNDPNIGIYSPGADQVAISTAGTGRLFVDANGYVDVASTSSSLSIISVNATTTGNASLRFSDTTANVGNINYNFTDDVMTFRINASERARIDSSGRLGLGTSAPQSYLDVGAGATSAPTYKGTIRIGLPDAQSLNANGGLEFLASTFVSGFGYRLGTYDLGGGNVPFVLQSRNNSASWTERLIVDSSGRVGIGTSSPSSALDVNGSIVIGTGTGTYLAGVIGYSDANWGSLNRPPRVGAIAAYGFQSFAGVTRVSISDTGTTSLTSATATSPFIANIGTSEAARIDSSGRLLVGTSTARVIEPYGLGVDGQEAHTYESVGDSAPGPGIALGSSSTTGRFGPYLYLFRSRGGSVGSNTSVSSGDNLGTISFAGADGTDIRTRAAAIYAEVDGTPGTNDMPGRLAFSTTADGASVPTERMRIDSSGRVGIGGPASPETLLTITGDYPVSATASKGIAVLGTITSSATGGFFGCFDSRPSVRNAAFTLPVLHHFRAGQETYGASATITNQYGFGVDSNLTGATNNFGFYSNIASGSNRWNFHANGTAANRFNGNVLIGGTIQPASATLALCLSNGTAPTGSIADGVVLYAEDVSASSELKVRDEAGNVTTLSPHNFDLIPDGPSEDMAWSYYSERDGKRINVDMLKAIRLLEQISGEKLVYSS